MSLTYEQLRDAVSQRKVGVRVNTQLVPLGGPGDKVFPPTYASGGGAAYAIEERRIDGESRRSVVLDAVASQSNRQELALLELKRDGALIPVVEVDFSTELPDLDRITTLEASHRVFDALFRDSLNGDLLFRLSPEGRAVTEATSKNAAAILALSPTTLLFGGWDSTGPKGGLGAKYERAITSEIVALGVDSGSKTASRIDVLGIQKSAGPVYKAADQDQGWTVDKSEAEVDGKGNPVQVGKGSDGGRPSQINHGNVVPSIDSATGGITADEIRATSVISFAQLRRLRFPTDALGNAIDPARRKEAELSAHCALAALGLLAVVGSIEQGLDLRSRCVLVAESEPIFELIGRTLDDAMEFTLSSDEAVELLGKAIEKLREAGLQWNQQDLVLQPTDKLLELIRRSREVVAAGDEDESDS